MLRILGAGETNEEKPAKKKEKEKMQYLSGLMALDPATHITGYAHFDIDPLILTPTGGYLFHLVRYGLVKAKNIPEEHRTDDLYDMNVRCLDLNSRIRNYIISNLISMLVLEYPSFQAGARGMSAARGGDTLKLAFLCGKICLGWELHMAEVLARTGGQIPLPRLLTPVQWKGQMSKDMTIKRCEKWTGLKTAKGIDDNWVDAVMIGIKHIEVSGHEFVKGEAKRKDL